MIKNEQEITLLEKAKAIIENGWTENRYAEDELGLEVDVMGGQAQCFCSVGALAHAAHVPNEDIRRNITPSVPMYKGKIYRQPTPFGNAIVALAKVINPEEADYLPHGVVTAFNDESSRVKQQVIEKFNEAIHLLRK